jgi:hypothetical protein
MFSKKWIVLFSFLTFVCLGAQVSASEPSASLVEALIQVESGGDDSVVGDTNLKNKAYGCLQIRQPCVDDVNRALGTNYRAEDCQNDRSLSIKIFECYIGLYATKKRLDREPTDEDRARIWNGGPNGWKKSSTEKYWTKVKKELKS